MTRETARQVHERVMAAAREIDESLVVLQGDVDAEELRAYKRAAGRLLDGLMEEFLKPIYREHPELIPPELDRSSLPL
jgi:hypothetical protein